MQGLSAQVNPSGLLDLTKSPTVDYVVGLIDTHGSELLLFASLMAFFGVCALSSVPMALH
jgi:hypothetical protein